MIAIHTTNPTAECPRCNGGGNRTPRMEPFETRYTSEPCPDCHGTGTLPRYAIRLIDMGPSGPVAIPVTPPANRDAWEWTP